MAEDLVKELRQFEDGSFSVGKGGWPAIKRAADRIEALEAENARLREALKPFADESLFAGPQHEFVTIAVAHCDTARSALSGKGA